MSKEHVRVRVLKELWQKYHTSPVWHQFDRWLDREFKANPAFGKRDRRWYSEYLFSGLRFGTLALHVLGEDLSSDPANFKKLFLNHNSDDFWSVVEARAGLENFFNKENFSQKILSLEIGVKSEDCSLDSLLLWNGIPQTWRESIQARQILSRWNKSETKQFVNMLSERPPFWIRLNRREKIAQVLKEFADEQVEIVDQDESALSIRSAKSLKNLKCFIDGDVEIQDWASQQIVGGIDFKKVKKVWDACAGAGGKTLQIASLVRFDAEIYASDVRTHALDELQRRATRAQFTNIQTFAWAGEKQQETYDFVLVDAPCTSSGIVRRNPELRFKIDQVEIANLKALQVKILQNASSSVKVSGYLCYGTCSFLKQENEDIVESFSANNTSFKLMRHGMHGVPQRNSDATFSAVWERG